MIDREKNHPPMFILPNPPHTHSKFEQITTTTTTTTTTDSILFHGPCPFSHSFSLAFIKKKLSYALQLTVLRAIPNFLILQCLKKKKAYLLYFFYEV